MAQMICHYHGNLISPQVRRAAWCVREKEVLLVIADCSPSKLCDLAHIMEEEVF